MQVKSQNELAPGPALPASLREAVRAAEETGRQAEERAMLNMPFRARLKARDPVRPQSTLSIMAGIDVREEVREARIRPRPAPSPALPAAGAALVSPAVKTPGGGPGGGNGNGNGGGNGSDRREKGTSRFGEISQVAFAGIAILGLAGLSIIAAENALRSGPAGDDDETGPLNAAGPSPTGPSAVSAGALAAATQPAGAEPQPWFDYAGVTDYLIARVEAWDASEAERLRLAEIEAGERASQAIALAEAADRERQTAQSANAAEESARQRLAAEEAERAAALEAQRAAEARSAEAAARAEAERLAALEAERASAALAEQQRAAEAEAARLAEVEARTAAEAEARRVAAEAEARRQAELEAQRAARAAEERRLAEIESRRAAEAEANRLAAAEARRNAEAVAAARLAEEEARRLAEAEAARLAAARAGRDGPVMAAVPAAPPARPVLPRAAPTLKPAAFQTAEPVMRAPPPALSAGDVSVRPLQSASAMLDPYAVDVFLAERVKRTAVVTLTDTDLAPLRGNIRDLLADAPDGSSTSLDAPDRRSLLITMERTVDLRSVPAGQVVVSYRPIDEAGVVRTYAEPPPVRVSVLCRDVTYRLPGQEGGRLAACQGESGDWTVSRPMSPTPGTV